MLLKKLDSVELELIKLKAMLLPVEKLSKRESRELENAEEEIKKGRWISGRRLIKRAELIFFVCC